MTSRNWIRVHFDRPCPICERPDWCLLSADEGAAICARIESPKKCGDAGWLHKLRVNHRRSPRTVVRAAPLPSIRSIDFAALAQRFQNAVDSVALDHLARQLELSVTSLHALGIGWNGWAWSFPMVNVSGETLGIRLRLPSGRKLAVKGGHEGLFLTNVVNDHQLIVCEGATDTAALLDLGFVNVVGRPSCTGGIKLLAELVRQKQFAEVVMVADGDEPGRRGADNATSVLLTYAPIVRVIQPPVGIKDARAWLRAGGRREHVEQAIQAAAVRRLAIKTRKVQ